MNVLKLSFRSLRARPAATAVSLLLLTLGVAIISLLFMLNQQLEEKFQKNISGIDMVVGAKGSPLQLILSAVFQIDAPTGNIALSETRILQRNRYVERTIPLAYGDSYQGFRIVGTETEYLDLYEASLAQGSLWQVPFEVVLGAQVAEATGLQVGDVFYSAHGLVAGAGAHDEHPFRVKGILEPSNSVLDGLILTAVESIWALHAPPHEEEEENEAHAEAHEGGPGEAQEKAHEETNKEGNGNEESPEGKDAPGEQSGQETPGDARAIEQTQLAEEREITALLVKFRNPMGMVMLPRQINERTNMQAAMPAVEINRLFSLLGIGLDLLQAIALAIIVIAALSFFLSLYNSLRERKYELALMRSMGASQTKIFSLLLLEGLLLSLAGYVLGIVLGHTGLALLSNIAGDAYGYSFEYWRLATGEWQLGLVVLLIGLVAGLLPAIKAIRTPISDTLAGK